MSSNLAFDQIQHASPVFSFLSAVLASLWRRKWLTAAIVAILLAVGAVGVKLMPHRYLAEAYVKGEVFAAPDTVAKVEGSFTADSVQALDLARVIETQTRLLLSQQLARRVVERIGLERLRPVTIKRRSLSATLFGGVTNSPKDEGLKDEVDAAAARLLGGLSAENYPRAYLIAVRFNGGDSELATLIVNTFVAELLRSANVQTLFRQRSLAQASLSIQRAQFGDKHPSVAQARLRLVTTEDLLKEQLTESTDAIIKTAGENVTKAVSAAPVSRTFIILLVVICSFITGVGIALWLERGSWWMQLRATLR
jgi:uncharacterized protein involved in exopolysaccharide biosynthesis